MSFYVSTATFVLLHCDEWDRVVALPRHKFVTGATLLQLACYQRYICFLCFKTKYTQTHVSSKLIKLFSKWKGLKIVGVNPTVPK